MVKNHNIESTYYAGNGLYIYVGTCVICSAITVYYQSSTDSINSNNYRFFKTDKTTNKHITIFKSS